MKTIAKILMLWVLGAVVACQQNDPVPTAVGELTFSYAVKSSASAEGQGKTDKTAAGRTENGVADKIVVTILTSLGDTIRNQEELNVNTFGVSEKIQLPVGDYQLTEFLVKDSEGNEIYATPLEGSPLAYLVNDPLPIDFNISENESDQVVPEVLSTDDVLAADFGYTDFSFVVVPTFDFLMAVTIFDVASNSYELTDANVQILGDGIEIYNQAITNLTNQIRVNDGYTDYTITTTKAGFTTDSRVIDHATLQSHLNDPLLIQLDPQVYLFEVFASGSSVTGGSGVFVGNFTSGQVINFSADPADTWAMHPDDVTLVSNADGTDLLPLTIGDLASGVGLLVGSWDDGVTYFSIGLSKQVTVPVDAALTLWCWDSDNANNVGSIITSVQIFN